MRSKYRLSQVISLSRSSFYILFIFYGLPRSLCPCHAHPLTHVNCILANVVSVAVERKCVTFQNNFIGSFSVGGNAKQIAKSKALKMHEAMRRKEREWEVKWRAACSEGGVPLKTQRSAYRMQN